ncbi:competence protein ComEC [Algoriphagus boseongensis]|uniref:Competence protein ComEC n=1 Tax=Algoriphagus boseongensis TaxID=1442587 RepID=A0A4R6T3U4_9BACT|nr:ComEC/Rec2 family competence protein [Algoriphagus boseongensis]TDQ14995.1 competence protein ComEC [Algoriphagus boseongensis]
MRFSNFPFLRYLPFFAIGILLGEQVNIPIWISGLSLCIGWLIYFLILNQGGKIKVNVLASLAYFLLFVFGFTLAQWDGELRRENNKLHPHPILAYTAVVQKFDLAKPNSSENLLQIIAIKDSLGWHPYKQKVLVYHQNENGLIPGQTLLVSKTPEEVAGPTFPNEFDYKEFLLRKGIVYRQFIGKDFQIIDSISHPSSSQKLLFFKNRLSEILDQNLNFPESKQIASALLLGEKDSLDKELRKSYAETGTMHILAVSGLHVGIIYAILLFPLNRLRISTSKRKIYLTGVVLLIWVYAVLTGFSPSVIRAATMFSLFSFGQMRARKPSVWNILAFSAMLMMVLDPGVIHEVGFQLSYAAVAGIVGLQPLIVRLWLPRHWILEYFWQLAAVSLAAQLATFPLSVYYFHIFPTYFLLANLIIVPMAFVSMAIGLGFFGVFWIPGLGKITALLLDWWIFLQNWVTGLFQNLPGGVMERLTISFAAMVFVWALLVIWGNWEWGNRKRLIYFGLIVFVFWRVELLIQEIKSPAKEIFIYSRENQKILDLRVGSHFLSWNLSFPAEQLSFSVDPNRLANTWPLIPEEIKGVSKDSLVFFPSFGLSFSSSQNKFELDPSLGFTLREFGIPQE